jgi:serine/threonine protein kinase
MPIHAVDEVGGFVFFVMSYVDGETLADRVRTRGPVSASDGVRMLREAAWALGYAHTLGVVHRDVKPDNILRCRLPYDAAWHERTMPSATHHSRRRSYQPRPPTG